MNRRLQMVGLRPMFPHSPSQPRGLPTTEPAFDFLRHQVYRGDRFVSAVFGEQVVAGNFIMNSRAELMR